MIEGGGLLDSFEWPTSLEGEVKRDGFRVEVAPGEWIEIPSPARLTPSELGLAAVDWRAFLHELGHILPPFRADAIGGAYSARYSMPIANDAVRLQQYLSRFRREIRADLATEYPGTDLAELYAAGRWVTILDYIDMLPQACRLNEALANDPEMAKELAKLQAESESEGQPPWTPRFTDYKLEHQMLASLIDVNKQMLSALMFQITNKKPEPAKPFPAPRTAIDAAREAYEREVMVDFVSMFGFSEEDIY